MTVEPSSYVGARPIIRAAHHRRFRWRGAIGTLLLVPAAILSLLSPPVIAAGSWWHLGIRVLAWATFLAGASLRFWATLYLGGRKENELVIDGPYSVVQHPLYVGSFLIGASAGLFLESLTFELVLMAVAAIYARGTIPIEESVLESRHLEEYEAYRQRVPRFWPSWQTFQTAPKPRFDVHALRVEFARASRWCWIPVVGEILNTLQARPWWPHLFRFF